MELLRFSNICSKPMKSTFVFRTSEWQLWPHDGALHAEEDGVLFGDIALNCPAVAVPLSTVINVFVCHECADAVFCSVHVAFVCGCVCVCVWCVVCSVYAYVYESECVCVCLCVKL
jgi:hypothetical protein